MCPGPLPYFHPELHSILFWNISLANITKQKCFAKVQTTLLASYPLFLFCLKIMLWKILLLSMFVSVVVASLVRQNACSFALLFVANLGCNILKKPNFYMFLWIVFNYYPIMWLLCFVLNKYYLNKPDAKFVCNVVVYCLYHCFVLLFVFTSQKLWFHHDKKKIYKSHHGGKCNPRSVGSHDILIKTCWYLYKLTYASYIPFFFHLW